MKRQRSREKLKSLWNASKVSKHQLQRSRAQLWVNTSPIAHNRVPSETHRNKTSLTQNFELVLPTVAEPMWQVEQICDISSWSLLTEVDEWQYRGGQAGTTASLSQGQTLKRATLQGVSLDIGGDSRKGTKDCSLKKDFVWKYIGVRREKKNQKLLQFETFSLDHVGRHTRGVAASVQVKQYFSMWISRLDFDLD